MSFRPVKALIERRRAALAPTPVPTVPSPVRTAAVHGLVESVPAWMEALWALADRAGAAGPVDEDTRQALLTYADELEALADAHAYDPDAHAEDGHLRDARKRALDALPELEAAVDFAANRTRLRREELAEEVVLGDRVIAVLRVGFGLLATVAVASTMTLAFQAMFAGVFDTPEKELLFSLLFGLPIAGVLTMAKFLVARMAVRSHVSTALALIGALAGAGGFYLLRISLGLPPDGAMAWAVVEGAVLLSALGVATGFEALSIRARKERLRQTAAKGQVHMAEAHQRQMALELESGQQMVERLEADIRQRSHHNRLAKRLKGLARAGVEARLRVAQHLSQAETPAPEPMYNK